MKLPEERTLAALCAARDIDRSGIELIGGGREDSDGVVYRVRDGRGERIFKVISLMGDSADELKKVDARLEFINYLGERGVGIAHPIKTERGIYSACEQGDTSYIAYETPVAPGRLIAPDDFAPGTVEKWGELIGLTHRLTKEYPIWRNLPGSPGEWGWQDEADGFIKWREGDEYVAGLWNALKRELAALPANRDSYGLIHNDAHQLNTFWDGERITLIDFDCAGCNFFLHDFVTPMQGLLFDFGGMFGPGEDYGRVNRFFDSFVTGYERENHLPGPWLGRINMFIGYRRVLLYCCLLDWIRSQPEMDDGVRGFIAEAPVIIK